MFTRQKDRTDNEKFEYEIFIDNQSVEVRGGFETAYDADRAAEIAHRHFLLGAGIFPGEQIPMSIDDISDEELELLIDEVHINMETDR
jgi:hypothetical protein